MGKTETSKQRRVDVYTRSETQKKKWHRYAAKRKKKLSAVVIEVMEAHISKSLPDHVEELSRYRDEAGDLHEEVRRLSKENARLESLVSHLEEDLKKAQTVQYTTEGIGVRFMHKGLVRLLQNARRPLMQKDVVEGLDLNPNDLQTMKGITEQIEDLISFGLVSYSPKGWYWNEQ